MIWMSWRQHRPELLGFAALFLGVAAFFVLSAPLGADSRTVYTAAQGLSRAVKFGEDLGTFQLLPMLVGVFAGAPLVARELDRNTFRFAWTQGVSRAQWLRAKVLFVGGTVLLLAVLYSAVRAWWFAPYAAEAGWFKTYAQGPVLPVTCLFTFGLGVLAGTVLRRTVPAMAVTLAGSVAVLVLLSIVRPYYMSPATAEQPVHAVGATADPSVTRGGWTLDTDYRDPTGGVHEDGYAWYPDREPAPVQLIDYHPAERFWTFQLVDGCVLLVLGIACLALAGWWLDRRLR